MDYLMYVAAVAVGAYVIKKIYDCTKEPIVEPKIKQFGELERRLLDTPIMQKDLQHV